MGSSLVKRYLFTSLITNTLVYLGDKSIQNMKQLPLGTVTFLLSSFLFLSTGIASDVPFADVPFDITNIPEPVAPPAAVRDFFDLDPFYQQWINVEGFPVLASAIVSPYAMKEAAWQIKQMIGHRSDILKALAELTYYFTVSGYNEVLSDIPEFPIRPKSQFHYDADSHAWLCEFGCRTILVNESNILRGWSSILHEMAHAIHLLVFDHEVYSTFDNRLKTLYNAAMEKGLWLGYYAAANRYEYWARGGVEAWFSVGNLPFIQTREALEAYDPSLAQLVAEVFGDNDWQFTPIQTRTHLPHLQGFDPQLAPMQEIPSDIVEARKELRNPVISERKEWVNLPTYDPSLIPRLNGSRNKSDWTVIFFVNGSDYDILLYWILSDGTEAFITRIPFLASPIRALDCEVGDLLVAKDTTGRNIAVFQAVEKAGRALVGPSLNLITSGLSKISGDNQADVSGAILANPFVIEVRDENLLVLEGIPVTFTVTTGDGTLSVTRTTTDEKGRAENTFTLGSNLGTNTVSVSAAGIEGTVTFNAVTEAVVDLPDPNLRAAIENALGKAKEGSITPSEMAALTRLEARNANISSLTGLEFATNLTSLDLGYGSGGTSHEVKDLSPLAGLTQLTWLHLPGKSISDISAVAELTNLTRLNLWGNPISDISPVVGLTNLTDLYLGDNNISDISPVVANTGLGSGDTVNVQYNPLSYQSLHTHIPALQSRGVTVEFDNRAHPALLKISGDNQNGASLTSLSHPFIVEAQDANGSALAGISVTFAVTAGGGTLSTTNTRTDANGRAQSTLTLGPNLGANTVQVSAAGIEVPATFHAVSDTEAPLIAADVNNDGNVNVLDLVVIASELGNAGTSLAVDVNGDGVVNVLDLILVAGMFDGAAAAPSAQPQVPETLTAVEVQSWLTDARALEVKDTIMKRGFLVLEQLLVSLTPKETELLANYPNPFNPETWIPYRLAEDAFVLLTIYDGTGHVVRTLEVGHRIASAYEGRSKAIYWDGRNDVGEGVASGVYFYTLSAGDYSATKKMVILK